MALTIGELVGYLTLKDSGFHKSLDAAERGLERMGGALSGVGKAASLGVLAGQAINLGAALAPAAGAVLALPAAMAALKVATLTTKVALVGMGEAMSAAASGDAAMLAEAMKKLTPAAQSFARAAGTIKKEGLDPIQKAVQERFFEGLTGPLKTAAASVLPTVKAGMVGVSGAMNGMAKEALRVAATPMFRGELAKVFSSTTSVLGTLKGGIEPLITSVLKLANAGAPLMQRMAGWAVSGVKAAAAFLSSEAGAAKLAGIVQRAGDTLATLGGIVKNVATGLGGLFSGATTGGGNLLTTIEQLTARFAAWANSAKGQEQVGNVFQLLAQTGAALGPVLGMLVGPLTTIAGIITSMPPGVQSAVAQFLAFSAVAGLIGSKLGPAIAGIRLLATGIGGIPGAVAKIGPAMTAMTAFGTRVAATAAATVAGAGRMVVAMATGAAGMVASAATMAATMAATAARVVAGWVLMGAQSLAQAARVAAAWVLAMGPIGWITAAVVGLVALIVANWDTIKEAIGAAWEWISSKTSEVWGSIVSTLTGIWEGIKTTAAAVWEWIKSKIAAFVQGALAIFQNFTLPGLIMKHWETIKTAAAAAWNWVVTQIKTAVTNVIAGVQALAELPGKVKAWFTDLVQGAVNKGLELVAWAKGFPAKLVAGLGNLATLLLSAGKDLVMGLINGVKEMAGRAIEAVKGVVGDAIEGAKNLLGIKSPSKVFHAIGEHTMTGWIEGVLSKQSLAVRAVQQVMARTKNAADAFGRDNRVGIDAAIAKAEKKAAQQKIGISGASSISDYAGVSMGGGGGFGGGASAAGPPVVNISMPGAIVREPADVYELGKEVAFNVATTA